MSHVISTHRPDDPRQTAVSDLSKVILCPVAPRFGHSNLVVRAKLHNHSAIAAFETLNKQSAILQDQLNSLIHRYTNHPIVNDVFYYFLFIQLKSIPINR